QQLMGKVAATGGDGTPGPLRLEHFDQEREGHDLSQGPFGFAAGELAQRSFTIEDGSVRNHVGPGSVRGWFKIDSLATSASGKTFFFDAGRGEFMDHLSVFYDASTSSLVARVKDESLDQLESQALSQQPRANAEIRFPWKPRPKNWYHLAFAWKGAD